MDRNRISRSNRNNDGDKRDDINYDRQQFC